MSNPRRTVAPLLVAALLTLLLPAGAHAAPDAAEPAPAGIQSLAAALDTAWDWLAALAALAEPPQEDLNGAVCRLPGLYEGSHLDPNGGER